MEKIIDLIKRNTPSVADRFILRFIESEDSNDVFEYEAENGKILLKGNNKISLACAYYSYLKKYCNAHMSHCGEFELDIKEAPLPSEKFRKVIYQKKRAYLDYITASNSTWLWDFERWEKELDFMAMRGINMALNVVGNDALMYYTLIKNDIPTKAATFFISGPAFYAWQMTAKIDSFIPRNSNIYFEELIVLAKKIFDRMNELGIEPVLSTFNGLVPKEVLKIFNKPKAMIMDKWAGYPKTFRLNMDDALFTKIFKTYMSIQEEKIGVAKYYMCDQLCNLKLKDNRKSSKYLLSSAENLDKLINYCIDDKPCLVFPAESYNKLFLDNIKRNDLLIFDVDGSLHSQFNDFNGIPFIIGNTQENSPHASLHGDIEKIASFSYKDEMKKHSNLLGLGYFPESLEQNPLVQELIFEKLTDEEKTDIDAFLEEYCLCRYKVKSENAKNAYQLLKKSCYSPENGTADIGSVMCTRPSLEIKHTAPFDRLELLYDNKTLSKAFEELLKTECRNGNIKYDLVFILRQILDNYLYGLYKTIIKNYYDRDKDEFGKNTTQFLSVIIDADEILKTLPESNTYDYLLKIKKSCVDADEVVTNSLNFLVSHTTWGPMNEDMERYDYYWNCLGGLTKEYYFLRWEMFFKTLLLYFDKMNFQSSSSRQIFERDPYSYGQFYKNLAEFEKKIVVSFNPPYEEKQDVFEAVEKIYGKYKEVL